MSICIAEARQVCNTCKQKNHSQRGLTKKSSKTALERDIRQWFYPFTIFLYHQLWMRYKQCIWVPALLGDHILRSGVDGGKNRILDFFALVKYTNLITIPNIFSRYPLHIFSLVWPVIPIYKAPYWATKIPTSYSPIHAGSHCASMQSAQVHPPW